MAISMRLSIFIALLCIGTSAWASDGVLEINQTCALNGGCFPGDSAGFPVTIDGSAGVSYRLTGSLDLSSVPDTTAIEINAAHVTLDMNGFEIAGPVTCTGSGPTLDCGAPGSATGIRLNSEADGALVRNGTIRNMNGSGVASVGSHRVTLKELRAYHNGRSGFRGGESSVAVDCIAVENGESGFRMSISSVVERATAQGNGGNGIDINAQRGVVTKSTARQNGGRGFELGPASRFRDNTSDFNAEPDRCGEGICTSSRRYYKTVSLHQGDSALNACQSGFHLASLWDLSEPSNLVYDFLIGVRSLGGDPGPPMPGAFAWVWAGTTGAPNFNCINWTSNGPSELGRGLRLISIFGADDPAQSISPWEIEDIACDELLRAWCVED